MADSGVPKLWHARERAASISTVLSFAPDGLVPGAGTVLLRAGGHRRLQTLAGREARVLALLVAAYGRSVAPSVLGNIERAAKAWGEGDDCLAYIHLAHARLGELQYPQDAAHRLVVVDAFLKAGGSTRAIFEASKVDTRYVAAIEKQYNPAEPRVPAGSGRTSGRWTRDGGAPPPSPLSYLAPGAASWLGYFEPSAAASLGEYALSLLTGAAGAVAVFGLVLIPSNKNVVVEGDVEGMSGLHYSWNPDERGIHLTYDSPDGSYRVIFALLDKEDVFRDSLGRAVGRVLPGDTIALDLAAISSDVVQDDEPRLCPAPAMDKRTNDKGLAYETYIRSIINPGNPTLRRLAYYLPNPGDSGKMVSFDDCERATGSFLAEIKDQYAGLLDFGPGIQSVAGKFLAQAKRQVDSAGSYEVRWYFSEKDTADFAEKLFEGMDDGRERIKVIWEPWPGKKP